MQIRLNKVCYGALSFNKSNPKGKKAITAAVTVKSKMLTVSRLSTQKPQAFES